VRHFFSPELRVFNGMTAPIDPVIVRGFEPLCRGDLDPDDYAVIRPRNRDTWHSDIRWISAARPETFRKFEAVFEASGIPELMAPYLDIDREVRLYAGFLVVRSLCAEPYFHVDWKQLNNEAFTLLTPITANAGDFGLLYKTFDGAEAEYRYKSGEAIVFGDHFRHSTKPGRSSEPVAILCFEFGSDRMEHWDKVFDSMGTQTRLFRKPDGEFLRTDASRSTY
jgi:hypothetical protein